MLKSLGRWLSSSWPIFYIVSWVKVNWELFNQNRHYLKWLSKHTAIPSNSADNPDLSDKLVLIFLIAGNNTINGLEHTLKTIEQQHGPKWKLFLLYSLDHEAEPVIVEKKKLFTQSCPYQNDGSLIETTNKIMGEEPSDFVTFISSGDLLAPDALSEVANFFNQHPDIDVLYTDEDEIDDLGIRSAPALKPGWSPNFFLSHPYPGKLTVYRKEVIDHSGGFRTYSFLASEYDLLLRIAFTGKRIGHLPILLYSRHVNNPAFHPEQLEVLKGSIQQREPQAKVEPVINRPEYFNIHWPIKNDPLISILICTRDKADYLNRCLTSIYEKSSYRHFEVIVLDNDSREEKTRVLLESWEKREPASFHCYSVGAPFNFSALNNHGVTHAKGELALFVNNDIEVISPNWLEEMGALAQQPSTGAVSPMLLFPNKTVQHAGIIVGGPSLAVHANYRFPVHFNGYMGRLSVASNFSAVTAACMMIKKELFTRFGGFDENLAISYNDVEFCLRLKQAGYYHVVLPNIHLYHHESSTRGYEDTDEKNVRMMAEKEYLLSHCPDLSRGDEFYHPLFDKSGRFLLTEQ